MYSDVRRPAVAAQRDLSDQLMNAHPRKYGDALQQPEWMPFAKAGMGAPPAYSYVFNNPIKNTDPNGRGCTDTYSCCIENHPNDPEACGGEQNREAERIRCKGVGAIARELCQDKLGGDRCDQGIPFTNCVNAYKVARGCPPGSG